MTELMTTVRMMSHERVTSGMAIRSRRKRRRNTATSSTPPFPLDPAVCTSGAGHDSDDDRDGDGASGTLSFTVLSVLSSIIDSTIRSLFAVVCACVALIVAGRIKPATSRRESPVPVVTKPAMLEQKPTFTRRWQSAGQLGLGAIVTGIVLAVVLSFAAAYAVGIVNNVLR
jgi:hypothetical protein